ncbi:MAG: hypothetical protein OEY99_07440 [Aigarchaeota archaeon]|nr:hypothetical protein [Aigarchaeota archaeon]
MGGERRWETRDPSVTRSGGWPAKYSIWRMSSLNNWVEWVLSQLNFLLFHPGSEVMLC